MDEKETKLALRDDALSWELAVYVIDRVQAHLGLQEEEVDYDQETEHMARLIVDMRAEAEASDGEKKAGA